MAGCHTLTLHLTLTDTDTTILDTVSYTHTHTHIDTYMAYINENTVQDITKVDGYWKNTNSDRLAVYIPAPCHSHACKLSHTHTFKTSMNKSTRSKMTNKSALTNTNMLTSSSGYIDTTLQQQHQQRTLTNRCSQWHLNLPCQGRWVCVCVCVPEYVCVCAVTDRSRVPVQLLSELAGTYGGVPWAASQKDWWIGQMLIDEPA